MGSYEAYLDEPARLKAAQEGRKASRWRKANWRKTSLLCKVLRIRVRLRHRTSLLCKVLRIRVRVRLRTSLLCKVVEDNPNPNPNSNP